MRVLLLADVHANWEALAALQRAESQPDAVVFAGDAVGYGPDAANCLRWLLANTTAAVRGNHDEALLTPSLDERPNCYPTELEEAARDTIRHSRALVSPGDLAALSQWAPSARASVGGAQFHLAHGTPADPLGGQLNPATCPEAEMQALFDGISADVIVLGHTHVPAIRRLDDRLIVNPGSLGQPRYGAPDATYGVWEDGRVQIKHLHYDHQLTSRKLTLAPLSPEVAEQLAGVLATGLIG